MKPNWLFFAFFGVQVHAETLSIHFENIPQMVKERNQHSQGAELQKQSAEAMRGHFGRSYLPKISANVGSEKYKTGTQDDRSEPYGSISAKMNIFRGGKDKLQSEIIDAQVNAVSADSEKKLREEIKKARANYWMLVSTMEIRKLLEETIEENEKNLNSARSRIRAGAATVTDRIEFEMYKLELNQNLARLKLASKNAERELAILLGLPETTEIEVPLSVGHDHDDSLLGHSQNSNTNPTVSALMFQSNEALLHSSQLGRWWTPEIDVYAGYNLHTFREREYAPQDERYESVIGIQLSLDLLDGFSGRAEKKQKELLSLSLQKQSAQSSRELQAKVEAATAELKLTHELIHQSEEALNRSKIYLVRTLDEYRRGVKNSPDVLSASERNFATRRRFSELRRDYQLARCELMEILGN